MSRDRWEQIKSSLRFNDNSVCPSEDKLFKVRPVIDLLKESFARIPMDHMLSLDEQMVPFKGVSSLKQYLPSKLHRWDYKLFFLGDVKNIVHNFEVYTGKIEKAEGHPDLGASSNIELRLSDVIPAGKHHLLYFDNWFTSLQLNGELGRRDSYCVGTVRPN